MFMNFSKLSVLVVEDVAPMQRLLADIIRALGVGKIYTASNGKQGYKKYAAKQPDIIVTDWHMPEIDGPEFIEKVRKDPKSPHRNIPVIMISGLNASARITKARDLGINEYLVKPFSAGDLAKRISHIVNQPRDFIITEDFTGPDRRRIDSDDFKGKSRRKKEPETVIKAEKYLQQKVGKGQVSPNLVVTSETVMEETKIDFIPIAKGFLAEFKSALNAAEKETKSAKEIKEDITLCVMQLKANAHTFKYDLIGELSEATLEFLEGTNKLDDLILEILNGQYTTLTHLVDTNTDGDGGEIGKVLKAELYEAYNRYNKAKAKRAENAFYVDMEEKIEA